MSMPFYVAPEQVMKDRADFASKNVARGRPLIATAYDQGILLTAENPSKNLHKISEIYDRIAYGGVGKYSEYDQLRQAGIRFADIKGYQYSREDVDARSLANQYGQTLTQIFTHEMKPLEVEILVAEVGLARDGDQLFHIIYDGTVQDEDRFSVLGGDSDAIRERMESSYAEGWALGDALKAAVAALTGPEKTIEEGHLEVAVLQRADGRRAFHRIDDEETASLLA